MEWLFHWKKII